MRGVFPFGRFYVHACRTFRIVGPQKDEAVDGRTNCKLVPKRRKSPNSVERERGGFARKRSILFSRCSKERYAAGHVNLKEITATHNHDTNHFPVFLRLSSDFPVLPDELLAVR